MTNKKCKYIFVTGGVLSGVGKGITAASIGSILKAKGFFARAICHELDHLDGVLYIDKATHIQKEQ